MGLPEICEKHGDPIETLAESMDSAGTRAFVEVD
jgi:hypothetical protein